jgi:hypothetical protein
LLLKGGKSLTKQFTVICDSVEAARKGLRAALALSETGEKKITLLPFALTAGDVDELSHIVSQGEKGIQVAPTMVQSASSVLQIMDPAESVIVITEGGTFLREKSNAEQLFESRHPLLLVQ